MMRIEIPVKSIKKVLSKLEKLNIKNFYITSLRNSNTIYLVSEKDDYIGVVYTISDDDIIVENFPAESKVFIYEDIKSELKNIKDDRIVLYSKNNTVYLKDVEIIKNVKSDIKVGYIENNSKDFDYINFLQYIGLGEKIIVDKDELLKKFKEIEQFKKVKPLRTYNFYYDQRNDLKIKITGDIMDFNLIPYPEKGRSINIINESSLNICISVDFRRLKMLIKGVSGDDVIIEFNERTPLIIKDKKDENLYIFVKYVQYSVCV